MNLLKALCLRLTGETPTLGADITSLALVRTKDGYIFIARPRSPDLYIICCSEVYELEKWFKPFARGTVVDVGAYIGTYTIRACKQVERVVAIEPLPHNFAVLKKNIELNSCSGKVILVNKAIGPRKQISYIYVPKFKHHLSYTRATLTKCTGTASSEGISVPVYEEPLDDILDSLGIDRIDLMKVDIEGYVMQSLPGMVKSLRRTKYLFIEIPPEHRGGVHRQLKELGFKLFDSHGLNYLYVKA